MSLTTSEPLDLNKTTLTLRITGELDHHRAKEIIAEARDKIDFTLPRRLVLDLSGLTFSDSSGIAVLLRIHQYVTQIEGELAVIHVQPQPLRLFETAGLSKMLQITIE